MPVGVYTPVADRMSELGKSRVREGLRPGGASRSVRRPKLRILLYSFAPPHTASPILPHYAHSTARHGHYRPPPTPTSW